MSINRRIIISLISAVASLFLIGSAMAATYDIKVILDTQGAGTGKVTSSAASSPDWEFSGWSDEFCKGRGKAPCTLRNLFSRESKTIIASFNFSQCKQFTYSEFGDCQLDGKIYRSVISANPPGCVGGNPIISSGCFQDPCASPRQEPGFFAKIGKAILDALAGIVEDIGNVFTTNPITTIGNIVRNVVEIVTDIPKFIRDTYKSIKENPAQLLVIPLPHPGNLVVLGLKLTRENTDEESRSETEQIKEVVKNTIISADDRGKFPDTGTGETGTAIEFSFPPIDTEGDPGTTGGDPYDAPPGGGAGGDETYRVDVSDTTVTPVGGDTGGTGGTNGGGDYINLTGVFDPLIITAKRDSTFDFSQSDFQQFDTSQWETGWRFDNCGGTPYR